MADTLEQREQELSEVDHDAIAHRLRQDVVGYYVHYVAISGVYVLTFL